MSAADGATAIAGRGVVTAFGDSVPELFEALCAGRTALAPLRSFDRKRFGLQHAYEIDDRPAGPDTPLRATDWLCRAVELAAADAGLRDLSSVPVIIGTGLRELRTVEVARRDGTQVRDADLYFGSALRRRFGATRTYTVANACAASLYACGLGMDLLASGEADTVVVAGTDSITESMLGLLDRVQPGRPSAVRPFDRDRKGVLLGEGAAAVVLRRGGPAPAVLRSVALGCDAQHVTAPDPEGILRTIQEAQTRAELSPEEIDLVMAHGTGTLLNDEAEATALSKAFAGCSPAVTAIKAATGHTSGTSGLLALNVAVEALRTGRVPPTPGVHALIPEAAGLDVVCGRERPGPLRIAQVDAFGFGGLNAVALVEGTA
ncbi:beta-ketoacyl synthase N-terminal-like domain-containing protein [Streptomyces sp. NBC_00059]|uniref:beta-ketoacyl synthase N-terminal-like domain-containing protein n=1 Tax=Streptomyces sp. NBC_00059 TaxID=2975635 RepID=UPI00225A623C|nr:beta-ketoacyl synthase N-terminal-like domain-containing protein [Streptomyces sp. NBC_00059]MCX5415780.1 3-oxoacyl-ACP synthase [Streptomyces sp. NBC_00059]